LIGGLFYQVKRSLDTRTWDDAASLCGMDVPVIFPLLDFNPEILFKLAFQDYGPDHPFLPQRIKEVVLEIHNDIIPASGWK